MQTKIVVLNSYTTVYFINELALIEIGRCYSVNRTRIIKQQAICRHVIHNYSGKSKKRKHNFN